LEPSDGFGIALSQEIHLDRGVYGDQVVVLRDEVRLIGIGDRVTRQAGVVIHEIIHIPVTQCVGEYVLPRVEVLLPAGGDPF